MQRKNKCWRTDGILQDYQRKGVFEEGRPSIVLKRSATGNLICERRVDL